MGNDFVTDVFPPHVINDVLLLLQRDVSEEVGAEAEGPGGEGAPMGEGGGKNKLFHKNSN